MPGLSLLEWLRYCICQRDAGAACGQAKSRSLGAPHLRLGETTSICPKRHQYVVSCPRDDTAGWESCLKKLVLDADWTVLGGPGKGGSEPMALSENKACSVGRRWVHSFNHRKAKKEIPAKLRNRLCFFISRLPTRKGVRRGAGVCQWSFCLRESASAVSYCLHNGDTRRVLRRAR